MRISDWSSDVCSSDLKVVEVENLGSYNCRKIAGREAQSEHSTANAIDISAFILADGTRITLINDWEPGDRRSEFLHDVRDETCVLSSTVLSPDHNAAHANHFHFDMAARTGGRKDRSEEQTSELQSLMSISYEPYCLKTKTPQ